MCQPTPSNPLANDQTESAAERSRSTPRNANNSTSRRSTNDLPNRDERTSFYPTFIPTTAYTNKPTKLTTTRCQPLLPRPPNASFLSSNTFSYCVFVVGESEGTISKHKEKEKHEAQTLRTPINPVTRTIVGEIGV